MNEGSGYVEYSFMPADFGNHPMLILRRRGSLLLILAARRRRAVDDQDQSQVRTVIRAVRPHLRTPTAPLRASYGIAVTEVRGGEHRMSDELEMMIL